MADINPQANLDNDPDFIKFKQDPTTGLLSRIKDIKGTIPIEEYREIEGQKIEEMKKDFLSSRGQTPTTHSPLRFGRSRSFK